jgi:predicted phosphodiesterase
MRIAILADIHANLPAFEAALAHFDTQGCDLLVIAGDLIGGGPDSDLCWQRALSLGCPMVRGNQERYAAQYGTEEAPPQWRTEQFAPLQWTAAQFSQEERRTIGDLPLHLRLPEAPGLLLVHASLRSDQDTVAPHTPAAKLEEMFPQVQEPWIVRGHNHYGQVRLWDGRHIVTAGSVGLPLDGHPTAQYLLLEQNRRGWHVEHLSVPYDLEAAMARFRDTGYLEQTGPLGRLFFRELVTASQQIVPFLRLYRHWSAQGELSLEAAVERFFREY